MSFFKSEDFDIGNDFITNPEAIAEIANALIKARGLRVYGYNNRIWRTELSRPGTNNVMTIEPDAYQALVICIEERPKNV